MYYAVQIEYKYEGARPHYRVFHTKCTTLSHAINECLNMAKSGYRTFDEEMFTKNVQNGVWLADGRKGNGDHFAVLSPDQDFINFIANAHEQDCTTIEWDYD